MGVFAEVCDQCSKCGEWIHGPRCPGYSQWRISDVDLPEDVKKGLLRHGLTCECGNHQEYEQLVILRRKEETLGE